MLEGIFEGKNSRSEEAGVCKTLKEVDQERRENKCGEKPSERVGRGQGRGEGAPKRTRRVSLSGGRRRPREQCEI